jgi:hypothetical protein
MSKNKIDELNMVSRFFGDVFDNLKNGTADRIIKQVKQQGMPKEIVANLEKLKKDTDDLTKSIQRYNKKAKKLGQKPIKR